MKTYIVHVAYSRIKTESLLVVANDIIEACTIVAKEKQNAEIYEAITAPSTLYNIDWDNETPRIVEKGEKHG